VRKLTDTEIDKAQEMRDDGLFYWQIGAVFGVGRNVIRRALNPAVGLHEKRYRDTHAVRIAEFRKGYSPEYRKTHKSEIATYRKRHYETNKEEYYANKAIRRAFIAGCLVGATAEQKAQINEIYRKAKEDPKVRCYICDELIVLGDRQVDHILPVSKGGKTRPSNLAIACSKCNLSKGAKTPEEMGMLI